MTKAKKATAPKSSRSKSSIPSLPDNLLQPTSKRNHQQEQSVVDALVQGSVYTSLDFFSTQECQAWIDYANMECMDYTSHPASRYIAHRECHRWQRNDWSFADKLFDKMKPLLSKLEFGLATKPIACNGNLRLYRYDKGMSFGRHIDESNDTERGRTQVTVLIYLSDCQGGATRFYTSKRQSTGFQPQAGAILMHVHGAKCLEHEACPVESGIKYILRTDLIYK